MFVRVRWRARALELELEEDPGGARPAFARVAGWALGYRGEVPAPMRAGLDALPGLLAARLGDDPGSALSEAALAAWPGASIELASGGLPRWPSSLRIGPPLAGDLWPFDAETVGLERGLRRLVKREQFTPEAATRDAAWLRARGFAVSDPGAPDADGRRVIFAARDAASLAEAEALERQLRRGDGASADAGRRLGEALGYPACCIEAYARVPARDDRGLAEALLPPLGRSFSPLTVWLLAPLGIVSHTPCALDCPATLTLARALLGGLEAEAPGFEARWRDLAARVHLVSERRALALDVDHGLVRRATELTLPEGLALDGWIREAPGWVGRGLRLLDDPPRVTIEGERFWVADHRG